MRRLYLLFALGSAFCQWVAETRSHRPASQRTRRRPRRCLCEFFPTAKPTNVEDPAVVVTGPIIVEHQLDLAAQRDGVIQKIFFDTPSRVKAGALLAQMDDRQLAANLEAVRAKSRSIEADLKNWESETEVLKADYVRAQHMSIWA